MSFYKLIRPLLFLLPAETSHDFATWVLKNRLAYPVKKNYYPDLATNLFGIDFPNPVGLAAGFDKNAVAINGLFSCGFGFVEVGTATPLAQPGNPKPRLFRLVEDRAIINRFGFNNLGADKFVENLSKRPHGKIIGANIGKNKNSEDNFADYITMLDKVYGHSDYITINISSPNTPGLRNLQAKESLDTLLDMIIKKRLSIKGKKHTPILLKISPDTSPSQMEDIAEISLKHKIDGLIVSNTTIARENLKSKHAKQSGGLSGNPLMQKSTNALKDIYKLTNKKIPIIGVGGISSGDDAYEKIKSGASLIQIYSALIYEGPELIEKINSRLSILLKQDGFNNISDAVGVNAP